MVTYSNAFFVIISGFTMLCHIVYSSYSILSESSFHDFHILLLFSDSIIFFLLLFGKHIRFGRILRSFFVAQWTLFLANIEMFQGKDRRYWNQDIESRKTIIRDSE